MDRIFHLKDQEEGKEQKNPCQVLPRNNRDGTISCREFLQPDSINQGSHHRSCQEQQAGRVDTDLQIGCDQHHDDATEREQYPGNVIPPQSLFESQVSGNGSKNRDRADDDRRDGRGRVHQPVILHQKIKKRIENSRQDDHRDILFPDQGERVRQKNG